MVEKKRMLVDIGMDDLPIPIKALSRVNPDGQNTIGGFNHLLPAIALSATAAADSKAFGQLRTGEA